MNETAKGVGLLLEILAHKRPHDDLWEKRFVQEYILKYLKAKQLPYHLYGPMENVLVKVGQANDGVLFSCHTDTVHMTGGVQEVKYDPGMGTAYKADKECLGADDGTGVWLMLEMIERGVEGWYAFHRGEERGCIGSRWVSINCEAFLKEFDYAIAFDRKNENNIITHQRGTRTCSDEFATALAAQLNAADTTFTYAPDDTGVYTDTANYDRLIPECTNISIGYTGAHSDGEIQDVDFAAALLEALCVVKWSELPAVRDPKKVETKNYDYTSHYRGNSYSPPYNASRSYPYGHMNLSIHEIDQFLNDKLRSSAGQVELAKYCTDLARPVAAPQSMNEIVTHVPCANWMMYLVALQRMHPERAAMVMYQGLLYYQHYSRHLKLTTGEDDFGRLNATPGLTDELLKKYDRTTTGILVERTGPAVTKTPPTDEVKAAREARKASRKAAKLAKKGRGVVSGTSRFPTQGTGVRPSVNPMTSPRLALEDDFDSETGLQGLVEQRALDIALDEAFHQDNTQSPSATSVPSSHADDEFHSIYH